MDSLGRQNPASLRGERSLSQTSLPEHLPREVGGCMPFSTKMLFFSPIISGFLFLMFLVWCWIRVRGSDRWSILNSRISSWEDRHRVSENILVFYILCLIHKWPGSRPIFYDIPRKIGQDSLWSVYVTYCFDELNCGFLGLSGDIVIVLMAFRYPMFFFYII